MKTAIAEMLEDLQKSGIYLNEEFCNKFLEKEKQQTLEAYLLGKEKAAASRKFTLFTILKKFFRSNFLI